MSAGYVYVLKNRAFPALKIGSTQKTPQERAAELSGTSNPHPYRVVYSVAVNNCRAIEHLVHEHFAEQRVSPNREFFHVSVDAAKAAIDEIVRATAYAPKVEPEPEEEMLRLAYYPDCPPPHNTHLPTNRFAEDIWHCYDYKRRREIGTKYPLLHASLNIHCNYDIDPEQSGEWAINFDNLHGRNMYYLWQCEASLEKLIKAGYRIRRGVGYVTAKGAIHAQLYPPGTAPLNWFKIHPGIVHPSGSCTKTAQSPGPKP